MLPYMCKMELPVLHIQFYNRETTDAYMAHQSCRHDMFMSTVYLTERSLLLTTSRANSLVSVTSVTGLVLAASLFCQTSVCCVDLPAFVVCCKTCILHNTRVSARLDRFSKKFIIIHDAISCRVWLMHNLNSKH